MGAMRAIWISSLLAASLAAFSLTGCTIYGEKKPPTLKSTTSAEQYERIFWSTVKAKNWQQIPGMLAANVMYSAGGKILSKDQVISYLQADNITDFTITGMVVKPNGADMTLNYTLQLSSAGAPVQTYTAISVWQQVSSGWILTVHTEQPQSPAGTAELSPGRSPG
jgi:ATP/ADP translocase